MTKTVTLRAPDYSKSYVLKTDASGSGVGAVLEQEVEGILYPMAFYSRKLVGAEARYSASELEALAIVEAIKHFEGYLKGVEFKIETDHKALTFIQNMKRKPQTNEVGSYSPGAQLQSPVQARTY